MTGYLGVTTSSLICSPTCVGILSTSGSGPCDRWSGESTWLPSRYGQPWLLPRSITLTVSHVRYPTELAISFAPRGFAGSGAQLSLWGFRSPYAQISGRAPLVLTNGLSFGIR